MWLGRRCEFRDNGVLSRFAPSFIIDVLAYLYPRHTHGTLLVFTHWTLLFLLAQIGAANSAAIWKSLATTALTTGESIVNYLEDSSHSFSDRLGLALGVFAAVGYVLVALRLVLSSV